MIKKEFDKYEDAKKFIRETDKSVIKIVIYKDIMTKKFIVEIHKK